MIVSLVCSKGFRFRNRRGPHRLSHYEAKGRPDQTRMLRLPEPEPEPEPLEASSLKSHRPGGYHLPAAARQLSALPGCRRKVRERFVSPVLGVANPQQMSNQWGTFTPLLRSILFPNRTLRPKEMPCRREADRADERLERGTDRLRCRPVPRGPTTNQVTSSECEP